jgi:uncharacterized protein YecE (DUF72 family)
MRGDVKIGTAGWTIPKQHAEKFAAGGSHLERYARCFPAVEINSSFYRPHRPATYARWAASVPEKFRFAAKLPREISHRRRLVDVAEPLQRFLGEIAALGDRLGPVLVQLPPGLGCDVEAAEKFFAVLREQFGGGVVCEPRHASWFTGAVEALLRKFRIARVAADPAPAAGAQTPGGWPGLVYRRLHGAPKMYYSAYPAAVLDDTAAAMRAEAADGRETWCIFDNTAQGAATGDALALLGRL